MKVGSLFTGYGGLDMAVGGELAWYAEIEKAACQVLAAHHPSVPNLGDITAIDWADIEPVDILTGGYPCQPFSHAGQRKGKNDERHLWPYVLDAIRAIRPRYAILENVSGHLSLGFDSVLTDLAKIGWAAEWGTFRASDIGAPHRRDRLFIIAYADSEGLQGTDIGLDLAEGRRDARGHAATSVDNAADTDWGKYAPAIRRWESVLDRPAPAPTVERKDKRRLNPQFVEWMMGLPDGWLTGHGLSAAQELKMLGNGVVPQQAHAAITQLMERAQAWASSKT
jgi:DNA (cytosine-5)-methyltransferase 1